MASITEFEDRTRTLLAAPNTIDGLLALRDLPVTTFDGSVHDAPRGGFVIAVDHGEHWASVGMSESSRQYGTLVVGSYNGDVLVAQFIPGRYRYDPDARSHGGSKGALREDGFDMPGVEATMARITADLRKLVEQAVRSSMQFRADDLTAALADCDAGDWHGADHCYGHEYEGESAEHRARRELTQLRSVLDAPLAYMR